MDEHPGEIWNRDLIPQQPPFVKLDRENPRFHRGDNPSDPDTIYLTDKPFGKASPKIVALHEIAHAALLSDPNYEYQEFKQPGDLVRDELEANYRVVLQLKSIGAWDTDARDGVLDGMYKAAELEGFSNPMDLAKKLVTKLEKEADHDLRTSRLYNR